jgi:hypothetical protein
VQKHQATTGAHRRGHREGLPHARRGQSTGEERTTSKTKNTWRRGGHLTKAEQRSLNKRENKTSKQIYHAKHSAKTTGTPQTPGPSSRRGSCK